MTLGLVRIGLEKTFELLECARFRDTLNQERGNVTVHWVGKSTIAVIARKISATSNFAPRL